MKRFVIALVLFAVAGSASACAGCGIKFNGLSDNGISLNGTQLNGIRFNGTSLQGPRSSALAGWQANDWSAIPLSQVRVRLAVAR
jgi:hypothetical protein